MTVVTVHPGPAVGTVTAPPSKSYTHRALVVGHLSRHRFQVRNPLTADDTRATATALRRLGSSVRRDASGWRLTPTVSPTAAGVRVDAQESGTTLRFVTALAALQRRPVVIDGSPGLSGRPIDELLRTLRTLGADCHHVRRRGLPIEVRGPIHGGSVLLDASQSSQFASALLMVLPTLPEDSVLRLSGAVVSRPYLDATLAVLRHQGIRVQGDERRFSVPGGQRYRGRELTVPGDASSAAYLWAAAAISGGRVRVDGVSAEWPQADLAVLDLLVRAGARVSRDRRGTTVESGRPRPFRVNLSDSPDLYPLAGVLAATVPGTSYLMGAPHVAFKESDRKSGTIRLARAIGASVEVRTGALRVTGTARPRPLRVGRLSDHRMVMSAAVAALAASDRSRIGDARAVRKSYPDFWTDLRALGGGPRA